MLLPTEYYVIGGALAVAASFGLLALAPRDAMIALFRERTILFRFPRIELAASLAALAIWIALVVIGFTGARDPLANPLPLTVWTLFWVGFTLLTGIVGNLWGAVNPWSGVMRFLGGSHEPLPLPKRLGYLPAIIGLLGFGWFELVYIAPDDPARLAILITGYGTVTLIAMLLFGEDEWTKRGEFLSVFFRFVSRIAPIRFQRTGARVALTLSLPGAGLISAKPPSASGAVFILCALAIVSFDGLCQTFWWLVQIDINPLAFPGRSAVVTENTLGLLAACIVLTGAFFTSVLLGGWLADDASSRTESVFRFALSMMPISLAYHFSHYLAVLMVNTQYALATATDPLARGDDWLGIGDFRVTTSFLNRMDTVETIWQVQSGAIVLGHVLAVCVAHRIALDIWPTRRRAALSQLPLAILMVAYTIFGLWLLASPTGA